MTPGRWKAFRPSKRGKHWTVMASGKQLGGRGAVAAAEAWWYVATVGNGAPGDTLETEGENAMLMAASPDLLAACKAHVSKGHNDTCQFGLTGDPCNCGYDAAVAAIAKAEGK